MDAFFAFLWPCALALLFFLASLLALNAWHNKKKNEPSALLYSDIRPLKAFSNYGKGRFLLLPYFLLLTALASLMLAWWNPPLQSVKPSQATWKKELPPLPSEGVAFYLLLDRSGSMDQVSPLSSPPIRKIELLKRATSRLIRGAPQGDQEVDTPTSDLIGMIGFARSAQVLSPLTLDRVRLQELLSRFQIVQTEQEDGTGIGYAIFKAVQLIASTRELAGSGLQNKLQHYDIQNAFLIVLTDGFQDPNPLDRGKWLRTMDLEEASDYAKKEGVKIYVINMEPSLAQEAFAPHRHLLESITEKTGGQFFLLSQTNTLDKAYDAIREKERTLLPLGFVRDKENAPLTARKQTILVPFLLILALICLTVFSITLSTSHRMVP